MSAPRTSLVARVGLVLFSLLLLAGIDGAIRLTGVNEEYRATHPSRFSQQDPALGYRLRPNLEMTATPVAPLAVDRVIEMAPLPSFTVRTNGQGFREDEEIPRVRPEGEFRVLCLGDSVTFGYGTDREQTYPYLLESMLRQDESLRRVRVVNVAQPGHSSIQGLRYFETRLSGFEADAVVMAYGHNDYGVGILGYDTARERFESITSLSARVGWLLKRSELYLLLVRAWDRRGLGERGRPPGRLPPPEAVRGSPEDYESSLVGIAELARKRGVDRIVVVTQPRVPGDVNEPFYREAARRAAEQGGAVLADAGEAVDARMADLPEPPGGWNRAPNRFFVDVTHLTAEGNRVVASVVYDALTSPEDSTPP